MKGEIQEELAPGLRLAGREAADTPRSRDERCVTYSAGGQVLESDWVLYIRR
jgi:hypothetical protein